MKKKNWLLTVRVNGLTRAWLEKLMITITDMVRHWGGDLSGGFEELSDEAGNEQSPQS